MVMNTEIMPPRIPMMQTGYAITRRTLDLKFMASKTNANEQNARATIATAIFAGRIMMSPFLCVTKQANPRNEVYDFNCQEQLTAVANRKPSLARNAFEYLSKGHAGSDHAVTPETLLGWLRKLPRPAGSSEVETFWLN